MIPKILHFVWLGGKLPKQYEIWRDDWERLHMDWQVMRWDDTNLKSLTPPKTCCHVRQRSNWIRLYLLQEYGGVYTDYDTQPLKNIEPLLRDTSAVASPFFATNLFRPNWCCNSFLAATPNHPWINECVGLLQQADPSVHLSMGSDLISKALDSHPEVLILHRDDILQWPFWYKLGRKPKPRYYAIHHFDNMSKIGRN